MMDLDLPVVTLYVENAKVSEVGGKKIANVHLTAHIDDLDLWQSIEKKLNGLVLSSAESLHAEVLGVLQDELDKTTHDLSQIQKKNRETNLELLQQVDMLQAKCAQTEYELSVKNAEVTVLKEQLALLKTQVLG